MLAVEKGGGGKTIRHKETFLPARTDSHHNTTRKPRHRHLAGSNVCKEEREEREGVLRLERKVGKHGICEALCLSRQNCPKSKVN